MIYRFLAALLAALLVLGLNLPAAMADAPVRADLRADIFDYPMADSTAICSDNLTPRDGAASSAFRVQVALRTTASKISVRFTRGSVSYSEVLNADTQLAAGRHYTFLVIGTADTAINFTLATTSHLAVFTVEEIATGQNP